MWSLVVVEADYVYLYTLGYVTPLKDSEGDRTNMVMILLTRTAAIQLRDLNQSKNIKVIALYTGVCKISGQKIYINTVLNSNTILIESLLPPVYGGVVITLVQVFVFRADPYMIFCL